MAVTHSKKVWTDEKAPQTFEPIIDWDQLGQSYCKIASSVSLS